MMELVILYAIFSALIFGIFFIAALRFKMHKKRYPLPEDKFTLLFGFLKPGAVIFIFFIILVAILIYFGYLLFIF